MLSLTQCALAFATSWHNQPKDPASLEAGLGLQIGHARYQHLEDAAKL